MTLNLRMSILYNINDSYNHLFYSKGFAIANRQR